MQISWDERYNTSDYIYGTEPNLYFKEFVDTHAPGKLFLPGEGEGRNAVYAAQKGWTVDAIDQSRVARKKALDLALSKGVEIRYEVVDLQDYQAGEEVYDAIGLFYLHSTPDLRGIYYPRLLASLKPGGYVFMEVFSKKQVNNTSGGPQDPAMLFSVEEIRELFRSLDIIELYEYAQILDAGLQHQGKADTIRMIAQKRNQG